jgi:choline monooxygenase
LDARLDDRIFAELRQDRDRSGTPEGFAPLPEIPGGRYTRQDFFDLEVRHVFRRSWALAAHVDELDGRGGYKRFDRLMNAPIVIVRGRDGEVRAFYNTCRHRGAPVVKDEAGRCNLLRCQYHSWAYDLDGTLVQVPDERDFAGLDKAARGLIPVRCETFLGLVFVNEDPDAQSLREWLGPIADEWAMTGLADWTVDYRWSRVMNCNWKCACDAFQEVYHINTVHPTSVGLALDRTAATMGLMANGHSRMCVRRADADIDRAPETGWPSGEIFARTSVAHSLWPAVVVPWGPKSAKFIRFWPRSPGQCEVDILGVGPRWGEGPLPPERLEGNRAFDHVIGEDMTNLEPIQASLESGAFTGMRLSYQERRIYWAHEAIDRAMGEAAPPELRVEPRLARYVE